jgi:hypothetical protein
MSDAVVDLELHVELVDFFENLEFKKEWQGAGEAGFKWFFEKYGRSESLDYATLGVARLMGHPKGEDWEKRPRNAELDREIWTFHRIWVDRYGWEPTMREGKARSDRYEAQLRPR